jgi:hypothetical protein
MAVRAVIKSTLAALTAALVAAFFVPAAQAMICFEQGAVEAFEEKYGEKPVARGALGTDGLEMIFLLNPKTKSWTMLIIRPDKIVCPFATGENFELIKSTPKVGGQAI